MNRLSLRLRLLVAAGVAICLALAVIAYSLAWVFEKHVFRQYEAIADSYINQLISNARLERGSLTLNANLADPRFLRPISGYYWQVQNRPGSEVFRSRSLWDTSLKLPAGKLTATGLRHYRLGTTATPTLLSWEKMILLPDSEGLGQGQTYRFVVAMKQDILTQARNEFLFDILPYLLVTSILLMAASLLQVRIGLAPLDKLRRGIAAIRSGVSKRLTGGYPIEVTPLVEEANNLLEKQDETIRNARYWAANLAHGLKTPLTVLSSDADRLAAEGHTEIAKDMHQMIHQMQRRIDRELIRARVQSAGLRAHQRSNPVKVLSGIVRALERSTAGKRVEWQLNVAATEELCTRISADNLAELFGNLLENAQQWARHEVRIDIRQESGQARITIEDDGPGVAPDQLENLGQRGMRLEESLPGSGLGLAIAKDIVTAYEGELRFSQSSLGGLKVLVMLDVCA